MSKGWNIIDRFSEDIDISLNRDWFIAKGYTFARCENKTQRERLRRKSREIITTEVVKELEEQLAIEGIIGYTIYPITEIITNEGSHPINPDKDPTVLHVMYNSIIGETTWYIQPIVKIEISCLNLSEPFEPRPITSMISQIFPEEDNDCICIINTVSPERTFIEKTFLLNEEFQKINPRTQRMSRHYYDLEKLMDTEFGKKALSNKELYNRIIEHRRKYNALRYVDYDLNQSDKIQIIPPSNLISNFEKDYTEMKNSMVFKDALAFETLMQRIQELQNRIRRIK